MAPLKKHVISDELTPSRRIAAEQCPVSCAQLVNWNRIFDRSRFVGLKIVYLGTSTYLKE